MRAPETNADPLSLGLQALVWTLGDQDRAQRLLDTTGLDAADLRTRAGEPAVLAAVLGFLEAYEPDLIACAADLEVKPAAIVHAREALEA